MVYFSIEIAAFEPSYVFSVTVAGVADEESEAAEVLSVGAVSASVFAAWLLAARCSASYSLA